MKYMNLIFIFSLLVLPLFSFAQEEFKVKDPHHKGLMSTINLGIRYSSILQNRGVVMYRDFQIDPVLTFFFLDDKLEFVGDSLGYRDFIAGDWLRLRTRIAAISDKPLFPAYDAIKSPIHRTDSYEWSNSIEMFLPGYNDQYLGEIDLRYAKDISAHWGNYVDLTAKVRLFDFRIPLLKMKAEPNLYSTVGWGDSAHNQYFYGPTATKDGVNNISYGIWTAFPEEADRFYPIIKLAHFEVLGDSNRSASYAKDNSDGWIFSVIATYGILK